MNSQNAAQYLPLIKALSKGKTIQINTLDKQWMDADSNIDFIHSPLFYRIKPERKTITGFVNVYPDMGILNSNFFETKKDADLKGYNKRIACVPVTITYEEGEGL